MTERDRDRCLIQMKLIHTFAFELHFQKNCTTMRDKYQYNKSVAVKNVGTMQKRDSSHCYIYKISYCYTVLSENL